MLSSLQNYYRKQVSALPGTGWGGQLADWVLYVVTEVKAICFIMVYVWLVTFWLVILKITFHSKKEASPMPLCLFILSNDFEVFWRWDRSLASQLWLLYSVDMCKFCYASYFILWPITVELHDLEWVIEMYSLLGSQRISVVWSDLCWVKGQKIIQLCW